MSIDSTAGLGGIDVKHFGQQTPRQHRLSDVRWSNGSLSMEVECTLRVLF